MATGDISQKWYGGSLLTLSHAIQGLASSTTRLAGFESAEIDLSVLGPVKDIIFDIKTMTGTSPTANRQIEFWVIPCKADGTYPLVFDGTSSAETIGSDQQKQGLCRIPLIIFGTNATSDHPYEASNLLLSDVFETLPKKLVLFTTHDTGVALNATAGNHVVNYQPVYDNVSP